MSFLLQKTQDSSFLDKSKPLKTNRKTNITGTWYWSSEKIKFFMIAQIPNSPGTVWFRLYPLFPAWYQGRYPISWEFQLHEHIRFHFHYNKSALLIFLPPSFDWPTQHRHSISAKNIPTLTNHLSITIRQRTEPNSFNYSFPILHCAAALLPHQISRSSATLPISELHLGDAAPVLPITGSKPTEQFKLMFQSTSVDLWEKLCPRGVVPPTAILSWPKRFPFRHSKANGSNSKSDEVWNTVWTHGKINGTSAEMTRWLSWRETTASQSDIAGAHQNTAQCVCNVNASSEGAAGSSWYDL